MLFANIFNAQVFRLHLQIRDERKIVLIVSSQLMFLSITFSVA